VKRQNYFITGTDTGCGKTEVTLGLMARFQARGERVLGMKPVASGAAVTAGGLRNDDALRIQAQGSFQAPYGQLNPYVFEPPIAPHLAARQAGRVIAAERIAECCRSLSSSADRVLVEGVGGWQVPLGDTETVADLARHLGFPVLLVVGMRLGCINHALLSVQSILASGCELAGWVANQVDPRMQAVADNLETLRQRIGAPLLGHVPALPEPDPDVIAGLLTGV